MIKTCINKRIYDVLYFKNNTYIPPVDISKVDVGYLAFTDGEYIYPYRNNIERPAPGFYFDGAIYQIIKPDISSDNYDEYLFKNAINFSNSSNYREYVENQRKFTSTQSSLLTTADELTLPVIKENDTPIMKLLKRAIIEKKIDLDAYAPIFGPNYANDKRLLAGNKITLEKFLRYAKILGIEAKLILTDKDDPDLVNPMGKTIEGILTDE